MDRIKIVFSGTRLGDYMARVAEGSVTSAQLTALGVKDKDLSRRDDFSVYVTSIDYGDIFEDHLYYEIDEKEKTIRIYCALPSNPPRTQIIIELDTAKALAITIGQGNIPTLPTCFIPDSMTEPQETFSRNITAISNSNLFDIHSFQKRKFQNVTAFIIYVVYRILRNDMPGNVDTAMKYARAKQVVRDD